MYKHIRQEVIHGYGDVDRRVLTCANNLSVIRFLVGHLQLQIFTKHVDYVQYSLKTHDG